MRKITLIAPVVPQANSHVIQRSTQSPRIAAFYGLPRRLETDVDRISFDTPSLAPMAFVRFCTKYPRDCEIRRMAFRPRSMVLGAKQKAELVRINRDVNRAIVPQANNRGVMQEEWLVSPRKETATTMRLPSATDCSRGVGHPFAAAGGSCDFLRRTSFVFVAAHAKMTSCSTI